MRITAPLFALLAFAVVGLGSCATAPAAPDAPAAQPAETNVYALLRAGRIDEAVDRIRTLPSYAILVDIRARRKFEFIWSDPRLPFFQQPELMAALALANAQAAFAADPTDFQAAYDLLRVLVDIDRNDEAIEL